MNKFLLGLLASAAIALPAMAQTSPPGSQTERTQPPASTDQGEISPSQLSRDQIMQRSARTVERSQNETKSKGDHRGQISKRLTKHDASNGGGSPVYPNYPDAGKHLTYRLSCDSGKQDQVSNRNNDGNKPTRIVQFPVHESGSVLPEETARE